MEILQIVGIGLVTVIAALVLKQIKPEMAVLVSLCGGILLLLLTVEYLTDIIGVFNLIVQKNRLVFWHFCNRNKNYWNWIFN